jgi:hypothetical protein
LPCGHCAVNFTGCAKEPEFFIDIPIALKRLIKVINDQPKNTLVKQAGQQALRYHAMDAKRILYGHKRFSI